MPGRLAGLVAAILLLLPHTVCADLRIDEHAGRSLPAASCLIEDPLEQFGGLASKTLDALLLPAEGLLTSGFGLRRDPVNGAIAFHAGIDIAWPAGSVVRAARGGRLASAGWRAGCGLAVEIDHGGGLRTRYCHLGRVLKLPGGRVAAGEPIGRMGSTGRATGPHLHFEVRRDGQALDPLEHVYY